MKTLCPNIFIPHLKLDLFKVVWDEALVEDVGATSLDEKA